MKLKFLPIAAMIVIAASCSEKKEDTKKDSEEDKKRAKVDSLRKVSEAADKELEDHYKGLDSDSDSLDKIYNLILSYEKEGNSKVEAMRQFKAKYPKEFDYLLINGVMDYIAYDKNGNPFLSFEGEE